jgi:hypothetical protein
MRRAVRYGKMRHAEPKCGVGTSGEKARRLSGPFHFELLWRPFHALSCDLDLQRRLFHGLALLIRSRSGGRCIVSLSMRLPSPEDKSLPTQSPTLRWRWPPRWSAPKSASFSAARWKFLLRHLRVFFHHPFDMFANTVPDIDRRSADFQGRNPLCLLLLYFVISCSKIRRPRLANKHGPALAQEPRARRSPLWLCSGTV